MKTYHEFSEDIQQLQRDLNTLQTQAAPKQRLQQRRHDAKLKGQNTLQKFKNAAANAAAQRQETNEESVISEMPFQVTGPDPRSSDPNSPHVSIGKPYQSKKRAKTQADKLDDKIGGYRHKVKYVA